MELFAVDSHTAGNPTRVVVGGIPPIPGKTLLEKRDYLSHHNDALRRVLVHEPRGGGMMCAVLVLEAMDDRADASLLILEPAEYPPMCGHCVIGAATTLVKLGYVPATEPERAIVFETPAGLVTARVAVKNGHAQMVTLENVPSFVAAEAVKVRLDHPNERLSALDIVFGGEFYACIDAALLGLTLDRENARRLVTIAAQVRQQLSERRFPHPEIPELARVYNVLFYDRKGPRALKNVVVVPPGEIDRSPCGTGTSALAALLHHRGELGIGDVFSNRGILDTVFEGCIADVTTVGNLVGVRPTVSGRAYITAYTHIVVDPDDPLQEGFDLRY